MRQSIFLDSSIVYFQTFIQYIGLLSLFLISGCSSQSLSSQTISSQPIMIKSSGYYRGHYGRSGWTLNEKDKNTPLPYSIFSKTDQ
jgi:hypothetical protein